MSFYTEFLATSVDDALSILEEEMLPAPVRKFIQMALEPCRGCAVHVRATGHLYTRAGDYDVSNAEISVNKVVLRSPRVTGDSDRS